MSIPLKGHQRIERRSLEHVVLLLGSGTSLAAKMPKVSEITDVVLRGVFCGRPYRRHTDRRYYTLPQILGPTPEAELSLINTVYRRCRRYLDRDVTYEDVAYVIWQVSNEQTGNYENPAIVPFLRVLRKSVPMADLIRVAGEAYDYIACVVSSMLSREAELDHVPLLIDVARTASFRRVEIFTLNHDTLIEQELQRARIEFSDGFELRTPTCNYWESTLSKASKCRVRLYKLHGSIDWFRYRPDPGSPNRQLVGRALNGDFEHTLDFSGKIQWPLSPFSEMLIGSFNKILDYSGGIFADLFDAFRASLRTSEHLIVSGYGFRDKGVNTAIVEWLTSCATRKLVVIHRNPRRIRESPRLAIRNILRRCSSQVVYIPRWFEDATLEEVRRVIEQ